MTRLASLLLLLPALAVVAFAKPPVLVPEIDARAGTTALMLIGSAVMMFRARKR
jgi:hypothetical protein